jgi:hypothetical protein
MLTLLSICSQASASLDVSFADTSYKDTFEEQYSYDQHNPTGEAKHFSVQSCLNRTALRIAIYDGDKSHTKSSDTFPRSELAQDDKGYFKSGTAYTVQWDMGIHDYDVSKGYMFAFAQIFGQGGSGDSNVFLRWESGKYFLWCRDCSTNKWTIPGNIKDDIGVYRTWKIEFKMSKGSDGYIKVYKNGSLQAHMSGKTTNDDASHLKLGIYTQHVDKVVLTKACVSNLHVNAN